MNPQILDWVGQVDQIVGLVTRSYLRLTLLQNEKERDSIVASLLLLYWMKVICHVYHLI